MQEFVETPFFGKLELTYVLILPGEIGVISQRKLRFIEWGYSDLVVMSMMASTAFCGGVGKDAWGAMCDRFCSRLVVVMLGLANTVPLVFGLIHGSIVAVVHLQFYSFPQSFHRFGSYDAAFMLFICFNIIAVMLVLFIKYPNPPAV